VNAFRPTLDWIDSQHARMVEVVQGWSAINSGSTNTAGLATMLTALRQAFTPLGGRLEEIDLAPREVVRDDGTVASEPLGKALRLTKQADARHRVLLAIHMDTVFGPDHPFQRPRAIDANTVNGPGVADAKGGLAILLVALEALERSPVADEIGFQVLINPDEEIGSPGSAPLLDEAAQWADLGLLYEPALADGTLAGARKGSGNFTAVVRGRAAHAGRAFDEGRNAVAALARFIAGIDALNGRRAGATVNPARVTGGSANNIVPDLALVHFNLRMTTPQDRDWLWTEIERVRAQVAAEDDIDIDIHGRFTRPPKLLNRAQEQLYEALAQCGSELGLQLAWKATGGCCDGNNLAAAGLPNIDTLGARGGAIHSPDEFLLLDSLTERAKLSALFLMKLAAGEIAWPEPAGPRMEKDG